MADLVRRLLDLRKASFEPRHKNNLANEFWCYANFDVDASLREFADDTLDQSESLLWAAAVFWRLDALGHTENSSGSAVLYITHNIS
ncbi:hypothetical protein NQ318_004368 [Aromia moschata]|uniref:Uncharacterized protein n=1 Tax=Aromia moschata TaxID=1265417 RepID=A0AAV8YRH4_9CUCU|nr:hypothetical protein NQ318_004368 [Aromia moschata]